MLRVVSNEKIRGEIRRNWNGSFTLLALHHRLPVSGLPIRRWWWSATSKVQDERVAKVAKIMSGTRKQRSAKFQDEKIAKLPKIVSESKKHSAKRRMMQDIKFPQKEVSRFQSKNSERRFRQDEDKHKVAGHPRYDERSARRELSRILSRKNNQKKKSGRRPRPDSDRSAQQQLSRLLYVPTLENAPTALDKINLASLSVDQEIQARRHETAKVIPYFLSRQPAWREKVVGILKEGSRSIRNTWQQDLHKWYTTSLPTFRERLEVGDYPPYIGDALDSLADEGFSSKEFQQAVRAMPGYRYEVSKLVSEITKLEQEHQKTTHAVSDIEKDMKEIEGMLDATLGESEDNSKTEEATVNGLWGAVQSVSRWFSADTTTGKKEKKEKVVSIIDRMKAEKLLHKLERRKGHLDNAKKSKERTEANLWQLRSQREKMKPPLSDDRFEQAIQKVESFQDDICGLLADHIMNRYRVVLERYHVLDEKTDLTRPQEWFPRTRLDQRTIIFHAGPTNSGKTYNALQRLKEAKKGLYLGPLRLLAAEVYETLTAEGIYCNLFTGQEKREIPFATHGAATVEMALLEEDFDVVVIDEIQMIADVERGYAWTRALLGLRCKEIHVCGGPEAEPVLKKLAAVCGDHLDIKKYQRFSSLTVASRSLAKSTNQLESYRNVEKGDCVVAFSRNDIFAIKREIERLTNFKCCVVYGSLPPQTRSKQARLFNDPDSGYDVLVASDAIGMGLNLNIRRIIFNSMYKNDGSGIVRLGHSAVKQISGRAGRRNSIFPEGIVTCRSPEDMAHLKACMATDITPIERAGLLPMASHLETFDLSLQEYAKEGTAGKMYTILKHFAEMASIRNDYFLCRQTPMHEIAKKIDEYPLAIRDKYSLCMCPVSTRNGKAMDLLKRFAAKLSVGEVSGLSNKTIPRKARNFDDLASICNIFSEVDLFLWLQNKFPPGNYIEQQNAMALKDRAIELIGEALQDTSKIRLTHCYIKRDQQVRETYKKNQKNLKAQERTMVDEEDWEGDDEDDWDQFQAQSA